MARQRPSAIIVGDLHLREDPPVCRADDFWEAQAFKLVFLRELSERWECPILQIGDVFDTAKPSLKLVNWALEKLPKMIAVAGNHDLPAHSLRRLEESGLGTLAAAGKVTLLGPGEYRKENGFVVFGFPWGVPFVDSKAQQLKRLKLPKIALVHIMTFAGRRTPWPGCVDLNATRLLRKNRSYDLIVSGHNHQQFVVEHEGRLLVNAGGFTRQSASDTSLKPSVFLWYAKTNTVKRVELPYIAGVVSREHLEKAQERDDRIEAFASTLQQEGLVSLSFIENMKAFMRQNKIKPAVKTIVLESMESAS